MTTAAAMMTGMPRGFLRRRGVPMVQTRENNVGIRAIKVNCQRKRYKERDQEGHYPHDQYHPGKSLQDHLPQMIAEQDGIKDLGQILGGQAFVIGALSLSFDSSELPVCQGPLLRPEGTVGHFLGNDPFEQFEHPVGLGFFPVEGLPRPVI